MALGLAATPFAFGLAAEAFLDLGLVAAGAAASPSALVSALVSAFGLAGAFLAAVFLAAGFFALVAVAFLVACRRQLGMLVQASVRIESSRTVKETGSRKGRELEGRSTRKLGTRCLPASSLGPSSEPRQACKCSCQLA